MVQVLEGHVMHASWLLRLLAAALLGMGAAAAQDLYGEATRLYEVGMRDYRAAMDGEDQAGKDAAAAVLRQALELYDQHLESHPRDSRRCEEALTEINSILFWHSRTSVLDPGFLEEEPTREQLQEREAQALLELAQGYQGERPEDLYGCRAGYREVIIRFPGTPAADEARAAIDALDLEILARIRAEEEEARQPKEVEAARPVEQAPAPPPPAGDLTTPAPPPPVVPLLEELETRLRELRGSETERGLRQQIQELFTKRRFIEAQEQCRQALQGGSLDDEARIDRIMAGLSRAVTIMDHVVAEVRTRAGEDVALEVQSGTTFAGELVGFNLTGVRLQTELAELDIRYFMLSDQALVALASRRKSPAAELAVAAFLALLGKGKEAVPHLREASERGAVAAEVEALEALADLERAKDRLQKEIRSERSRWRKVTRAAQEVLEYHARARRQPAESYARLLTTLVKADRRPGLTDRDLDWLHQECMRELGRSLRSVVQEARETCTEPHVDQISRIVTCDRCDGVGTVPVSSLRGGFGIRRTRGERAECPTCKGKGQCPCPACWERFHWAEARSFQARTPAPPPGK
jgi:hypothetical protein